MHVSHRVVVVEPTSFAFLGSWTIIPLNTRHNSKTPLAKGKPTQTIIIKQSIAQFFMSLIKIPHCSVYDHSLYWHDWICWITKYEYTILPPLSTSIILFPFIGITIRAVSGERFRSAKVRMFPACWRLLVFLLTDGLPAPWFSKAAAFDRRRRLSIGDGRERRGKEEKEIVSEKEMIQSESNPESEDMRRESKEEVN